MRVKPFKSKKKKCKSSKKPLPRVQRKVTIPLNPPDIKKLRNACKTPREIRVIEVFLQTGIHPACISDPVKYNMDKVRGNLTWNRTKTFKLCIWNYPKSMEKLVDEFTATDTGFNVITYWRLVKTVATRANLQHTTPLTLRHTATIELLKKKSPTEVMRIIQCSPQVLWGHYGRL